MSRGSKVRTEPLDCSTPSLVHASVGLTSIPSWTVAEQVSVRGCPAMTGLMEWTMLTVGGKGAAEELYADLNSVLRWSESEKKFFN